VNETPAGRLLNNLLKEQQETNKLLKKINRHLWLYTSIVLLQIAATVIIIAIAANSLAKFNRLTQTPVTAPTSLIGGYAASSAYKTRRQATQTLSGCQAQAPCSPMLACPLAYQGKSTMMSGKYMLCSTHIVVAVSLANCSSSIVPDAVTVIS
jgi:hypothetical protein